MSRRKRRPDSASAPPPAPAPAPAAVQTDATARPALRAGAAWALGIAGLLVAALAVWLVRAPAPVGADVAGAPAASAPARVAASARPAYVDNQLCIGCHEEAGRQWQQSHHFMAMAPPTEATVRGDFANATFKHQGVTTRFFRRDGRYFVHTDGPDGKMADFEVRYTFGVDPLQQYLIETDGGRLQPLTIAWDTQKKRWFHLYPHEKAPPGDVMHWTGRYQTGNTMCIACHTTGYEKRYDAATDRFDTRWKEPNVSCQSCHGAGEKHVAWAQARNQGAAPSAPVGGAASASRDVGLPVDFRAAGAKGEVEVCAACHSRRSELTPTPMAGEPLLDNYLPARLTPGLYHADGQQRDEVYVYGSFRQSRMYAHGVRCTDCHSAHTGKLKLPGNAVCLQCHAAAANARYPSAAGNYDTPAHHFHAPGSAGAQCVSCHMPSATYMQVHARPDHSMRVPRPDLSASTGAPDACTTCHAGKPASWAAAAIDRWYGPARRRTEPHFGSVMADAAAGRPGADVALARLASDPKNPAIVRATALATLRGQSGGHEAERLAATRDVDAEVRAAAADSFENDAPAQRVQALAPLLRDPVRAVRTTAARVLSSVDPASLDPATRQAFDAALAEYIAAQEVALDMPGARLNLAVIYQNTGRPDRAEAEYLAALRIDPDFTPARANLAQFYSARARLPDAERVLAEGVQRVPDQGELQYSLGLVQAEQGKLEAATDSLARAAKLLPARARVHYNLGLALQQGGKTAAAERAFAEAWRLDPSDPAVPYAMTLLLANQQRWKDALRWAERLQEADPANPQAAQLVQRLRAQARG
jgi:tetratricopeptide (TPR) repeat protein